ncbi:MAG TPA: Uma2 family endonuclease [Bryobacteraceae bacterium]|jgi:Uma2 family endonuclease|nr:Uma2 family endonuclease [Bryobacteraceae bacterium]
MSAHPIPQLSPERYLEIERGNDFRSEYYDGQMHAMSGGTVAHSMLITAMGSVLRSALRNGPCRVAVSDLLVRVSAGGPFVYPDVSVTCGEMKLADDRRDVLLNPTAIVEILSKSTEAHDRGRKFSYYRQIESLQEYILVSQSEPRIETFLRELDGRWTMTEYTGTDATCVCRSTNREIPLAEIYESVPLPSE